MMLGQMWLESVIIAPRKLLVLPSYAVEGTAIHHWRVALATFSIDRISGTPAKQYATPGYEQSW